MVGGGGGFVCLSPHYNNILREFGFQMIKLINQGIAEWTVAYIWHMLSHRILLCLEIWWFSMKNKFYDIWLKRHEQLYLGILIYSNFMDNLLNFTLARWFCVINMLHTLGYRPWTVMYIFKLMIHRMIHTKGGVCLRSNFVSRMGKG